MAMTGPLALVWAPILYIFIAALSLSHFKARVCPLLPPLPLQA